MQMVLTALLFNDTYVNDTFRVHSLSLTVIYNHVYRLRAGFLFYYVMHYRYSKSNRRCKCLVIK